MRKKIEGTGVCRRGVKKTKCGGLRKKKFRGGGGMPETKCGGGGGFDAKNNLKGGMPDRVKKTKCGGECVRRKKLRGGMPERGKEDKMHVGVCRRGVKKTKCGGLRKKI